ncbi:RNA 2'-phosphotransferase [Rubellimicrobium rubrum]|uniref:Probable RNA 2'-phosphotransferase n=1 Tax=Rubellimicrobium rubrum TaxID=2585369 RepID=A0A5C4N493_9RHOB|nr:RNA 2'-phosphotransferase [Rubellimicrobium rubrum]TNC52416.1 RNA 2'-phosphotransferase [Rubellimicrobium rubrum]
MSRDSRLLSLLLRHRPDKAGLVLGPGGWVGVDDLLAGMARLGRPLDRAALERIVAQDEKGRFTLSPDGSRIRAAQGHSAEVDLGLPPAEPPAILFHGTAETSLPAILSEGLIPGRRRHVHLSPDIPTAAKVGQRHGRPVVLRVGAGAMHQDGLPFWQADNGVWLTERVPPRYLERLP